jgi:hypothetical protein
MIDHPDILLHRLIRNAIAEHTRNAPMNGSLRKLAMNAAQRAFDTVRVAS